MRIPATGTGTVRTIHMATLMAIFLEGMRYCRNCGCLDLFQTPETTRWASSPDISGVVGPIRRGIAPVSNLSGHLDIGDYIGVITPV